MNQSANERRVVAYVRDLVLGAALRAVTEGSGVRYVPMRIADDGAMRSIRTTDLVVVDLQRGAEALEVLASLRSTGIGAEVLCYFPHVNPELGVRAREVGSPQLEAVTRSRVCGRLKDRLMQGIVRTGLPNEVAQRS